MKRIKYVLLLMVLSMLCLSACDKTADKESSEMADNKSDAKDDESESAKKEESSTKKDETEKVETNKNVRLKLTDIKDDSRSTYKGTLKAYIDSINNKDYETYYSIMTLDGLCSDWCMSEEEFIEQIDDMKKYMKDAEFMYVELPNWVKIEEMQERISYYEGEPLYDGEIDSVVTVYTYLPNSLYGESHSIFVLEMYKTNDRWYIRHDSLELDVSKVNMNNEKYKEAQKTVEGAMDLWIEAIEDKNFDKFISLIPDEFCVETGGTMMNISDDEFLECFEYGINVKEKKKVTIYNSENIVGSILEEGYKSYEKVATSIGIKLDGIAVYECKVTDYENDLGILSFYFMNLDGRWYFVDMVQGEFKDDEESKEKIEESRQVADNNVCDTIKNCFNASLTDEYAYKEAVKGDVENGILIYFVDDTLTFDSHESRPNLTRELQEKLEGLRTPKVKGKTSYYISWELDEHRSINNIKVKTITKDEEERILGE